MRNGLLLEEAPDSCEPVQTVKDLKKDFDHKYENGVFAVDGTELSNDDLVYPCGSIAKYIYDDVIVSITQDGDTVEME